MEAILVKRMAEIHNTERSVLGALEAANAGVYATDLGQQYVSLQQQLAEIDHLLAAMDAARNRVEVCLPEFVPESAVQFSASI